MNYYTEYAIVQMQRALDATDDVSQECEFYTLQEIVNDLDTNQKSLLASAMQREAFNAHRNLRVKKLAADLGYTFTRHSHEPRCWHWPTN